MFKTIRIVVLLSLLGVVALGAWRARQRVAEWRYPIHAVVYPIVGDDSEVSRRYVEGLGEGTFKPIETFINEEAGRYDIKPEYGLPLKIKLAPRVESLPPAPPTSGNVLGIMWWSLQLRYWAWRADTYTGPAPQVRLFVIYFDPKRSEALAHSLGIEKGAIGVVNAFATQAMAGSNNVVIAHELLHTAGATDKYDPQTTQPRFPEGYAKPDAKPRYPQRFAEIMGGRTPLSESKSEIPTSLNATLIGSSTAREINWLE